jgi:hypothetical protein
MTNRKSFIKPVTMLFCLLILAFSSLRVVDGQKGQLPDNQKGATGDYVVVEGDILIPRSLFQELQAAARSPQVAVVRHDFKLWPNGRVPFEFDSNVTPDNRDRMVEAMAVLEGVANVDFWQCPDNNCGSYPHVHIQDGDGNNSSFIGMGSFYNNGHLEGSQVINIASWNSKFTIVHELLHCLGFFHEQSRSNRDNYIRINCDNIQDGCGLFSDWGHNFKIDGDATGYGSYDFDSVMHYDECSFSKDCPPGTTCACTNFTITVLPPNDTVWQHKIGQRNHLSVLDQASVSFLYPPPDWRFVDTIYDGARGDSNGTFLRPYRSFAEAVSHTPEGGTIWLLRTETIPAVGTWGKRITVKAAPGVEAILGG